MDRRATLRCLTPLERSVLVLWHRYRGRAADVEEDLRAALDPVRSNGDAPARRTAVTIEARQQRVREMVPQIVAKLERRAELDRQQEEREERERIAAVRAARRRRRTRMSQEKKIEPDGGAPPPEEGGKAAVRGDETWEEQVIRVARQRRAEIIVELGPLWSELRRIEAVLETLDVEEAGSGEGDLAELAEQPRYPADGDLPGDPPPAAEEDEPEGGSPEPPAGESEPETAAEEPPADGKKTYGPESPVPPELRHMPAVRGRETARSQIIESARGQRALWDAIQGLREIGVPTFINLEVYEEAGLPKARAAGYLKDFTDAGLLTRTGVNRRKPGVKVGKASVEYLVPEGDVVDTSKAILPDPPAPPSASGTPTAEQVRDAVARSGLRRELEFSPAQVCEEGERMFPDVPWEVGPVTLVLEELAGGTFIGDVSPVPEVRLFRYAEAAGPGRAAEMDRQRRQAAPPTDRNGSGPVAGTGKGFRSGNAEIDRLLQAASAAGAEVIPGAGGFRVKKDGRSCVVHASGASSHGVKNQRTQLRRIGVEV